MGVKPIVIGTAVGVTVGLTALYPTWYRVPIAILVAGGLKTIEWYTEPGTTEETALYLPTFRELVNQVLDEWDDETLGTIADDVPSWEALRNTVPGFAGGNLHRAFSNMLRRQGH